MSIPRLSKDVIPRVKRSAFNEMKLIALANNGIIFGGYIRDEIIIEYYMDKFHRTLNGDANKFWDTKYLPETKARTLIPSDIDISFANPSDADNFINALKEISRFSNVDVREAQDKYYSSNIKSIREVNIEIIIGAIPFVFDDGYKVAIKADVVIPRNRTIQPPFRNLDMLCNGFILKKDGKKEFSPHTGTILDFYSDLERMVAVAEIVKDLKDFKTALCFTTTSPFGRFKRNIMAMKRIEKMEKKKFKWNFINMPFRIEDYHNEPSIHKPSSDESTEPSNKKEDCGICFSDLKEGDKIAYSTSTKGDGTIVSCAPCHYACFMKHLKNQRKNADSIQHYTKFVFNCPYRNKIDFSRSSIDIQFIYKCEF